MNNILDFFTTDAFLSGIKNQEYPAPDERMDQTKWSILLAAIHSMISSFIITEHLRQLQLDASDCFNGVIEPVNLIVVLCFGKFVETSLSGEELDYETMIAKEDGREPEEYTISYLIEGKRWHPDNLDLYIFDYAMDSAKQVIENNADIEKVTYECAKKLYMRVFSSNIDNRADTSIEDEFVNREF